MAIVKFGDIVRDVKNNVDRANNPYEFYVAGDHMDSEELNIRRRGHFATDDVGPAFVRIFEPGQILYGSRRTYLKKVAVADFSGICANTTFVLESKDPKVFEQKLLPFLMLSNAFTEWSISKSKGSTNPYVLFSDLAGFEFNLPSIDEQKVLAEKLWAAYEVKQSYLKMIDATDEIVKAHYNEFVGDTQTNTHNWPIKKLSELGDYTIGLTYKPDDVKEDGTVVLRSGNIKDSCIDLEDIVRVKSNIKDSLFVKEGDILMCSRNGSAALVGKVAQIKELKEPMTFGAFMTIIRSPFTDYLFLFFQSEDFRKQISGGKSSTMNQITQYMLNDIIVPFADDESRARLSRILQQADKSKAELHKSIDAIDKVIKSLINENL